jgi:hypothetical protein
MGLGAILMTLGGFGAIIVLCPPGLKFLAGIVLIYAAVRTVRAFQSSNAKGSGAYNQRLSERHAGSDDPPEGGRKNRQAEIIIKK